LLPIQVGCLDEGLAGLVRGPQEHQISGDNFSLPHLDEIADFDIPPFLLFELVTFQDLASLVVGGSV